MGIHDIGYALGALSLYLVISNIPLSCYGAESYMFVFGDSLFDPGNGKIHDPNTPSSKCPYGMTFFHQATGRFSDGRTVPDFIATKLGIPFIPPVFDDNADFSYGANFAYIGAGVLDVHPNTMNLDAQFENFTHVAEKWAEAVGQDEARKRLTKAVYLISMGGNDYFSYSTDNRNASFTEIQDYVNKQVISNLSIFIENMYKMGARKFVFQSVGPLGCIPFIRSRIFGLSQGCATPPLTLAALHNNALYELADSIQISSEYSQFLYTIFDYYTFLEDRIRAPTVHGFVVGDAECYSNDTVWREAPSDYNCTDSTGNHHSKVQGKLCDNPSEYVFFDDGHNTDELNRQLSELLWSGGPDFAYPQNLDQLVQLDPALNNNSFSEDESVSSA